MKNEREYEFDKMCAYCMYMGLHNEFGTEKQLGFSAFIRPGKIIILSEGNEITVMRGDIISMIDVREVRLLRDEADRFFRRNESNELHPVQVSRIACFITAIENSAAVHMYDGTEYTSSYYRDSDGIVFWIYTAIDNAITIIKVVAGEGDTAKVYYLMAINTQAEMYTINVDVDKIMMFCDENDILLAQDNR